LEKFPAEKGFPLLDILRLVFVFDKASILRYTTSTSSGLDFSYSSSNCLFVFFVFLKNILHLGTTLKTILEKYGIKLDFKDNKPTAIMAIRLVNFYLFVLFVLLFTAKVEGHHLFLLIQGLQYLLE
jgi:hypothetical protein